MCRRMMSLGSVFAAGAMLLASSTAFAQNLKLPNTTVTANISGPNTGVFRVALSGVKPGFDVSNKTYLGYCMAYFNFNSPLGKHTVQLYDTTGVVPAAYAESWGYINHIINNKRGTGDDVQAAIWFFTDDVDEGLSAAAQAMVLAAIDFGGDYYPGPGKLTAVVVAPKDGSNMQPIIIEVPTPPGKPCEDFVTGGGWIRLSSGAKANFGVHGGVRKGAFWGGLNYIDHGTRMHVKSKATTGYRVINATTREINFRVTINGTAGTAVVRVTDNGEPGTRDIFEIRLSNGYSAMGQLGGTNRRGGGGNIQLHKIKCK